MARGRFITFEGGEGAGKSTQIDLLAATLRSGDIDLIVTREPGGAAGAEEIRNLLVSGETDRWDPITETLLHFAARRCHLVETIWPALDRGTWAVSDRFADSTRAYQGFAQDLGDDVVVRIYDIVVGDFAPDLTFVLDVPVETGLTRAIGKEDRYERMGEAFHRRVRQAFLEIAAGAPQRCVVVDADRDVETVAAEIRTIVADRLAIAMP